MLRIGLTGGVGAGKSTVSARLAGHGAVVIDADQLAREVVAPGTAGFEQVVDEFGEMVVASDGGLDRAALAQRVFADEQQRRALNAIVHPLVYQRRQELVAAAPADAVVVEDIPLLVENDLAPAYPLVVVVDAPAEVRVRRLVGRGMSAEDARARIRAQASHEQRRAAADVWLDNTGTPAELQGAVDRMWRERLVPFERNCRLGRVADRPVTPVVVNPDPTWDEQAARLVARVRHHAGARALRVDHIGSTAVPGLAATDVIDLQLVVDDIATAEVVAGALTEAGFIHRDGRWRDSARDGTPLDKALAGNADPARAVDLHVRPVDSPAWRDALLLRDWLRVHPQAADEWMQGNLTRADEWAHATGWSA